jgi:hypothetical protein
MTPADLFQSANTPMGAARLWITWAGLAMFIALIFRGLLDLARDRKLGQISIALATLVVVAVAILFLLPRS